MRRRFVRLELRLARPARRSTLGESGAAGGTFAPDRLTVGWGAETPPGACSSAVPTWRHRFPRARDILTNSWSSLIARHTPRPEEACGLMVAVAYPHGPRSEERAKAAACVEAGPGRRRHSDSAWLLVRSCAWLGSRTAAVRRAGVRARDQCERRRRARLWSAGPGLAGSSLPDAKFPRRRQRRLPRANRGRR